MAASPLKSSQSGPFLGARERHKISGEFHRYEILGGNHRQDKIEEGLRIVTKALADCGFGLDMVTGDLLLGDKGQRMLPFHRTPAPGTDPFTPPVEITNSRVVFVWENLSREGEPKHFEILAYIS